MTWLRPLGSTGLRVSALGLGTVKLGRTTGLHYPAPFQLPDDRGAARLLASARDLGLNLLDTAPAYGTSEERLGRLLAGQRRHWVLCTKAGEEFAGGVSRFDFSPEAVRASVRRSLQRLRTDVIDILLVHSDGEDLRIIDTLGTLDALADLKREGLIRAVGMSVKTVAGGLKAARLCDVVMLTYNLREQETGAVLEACARASTGALVKKPLASGHLAAGRETAFVQQCFSHVLGQPGVGSALVGTLSAAHLEQNVHAAREILD